ncbi:DUF2637 domain-containing protein [Micromonospora soli]|uniref:DUF2637 domain-containing protein n=1 Tax=Micromonospora sp. NBRC 110009 TaxID=3061627 RepID=UPI002672150D|nr:DUF2637 domain-containing protein [Micromonospora sp. NBRC 110009]WKU00876.1 DUF2637 domain-containing protein [Micromonospora sp. NBRC 110009]
MTARRFASLAGAVAVTVIAAVASYDHTRTVALDAEQPPFLAALLPLSVDGLVLVGTMALGDGRRSRWSAWAAFLVGVAASLAANVMAAEPDAVSRAVSAWPAVALLLTVEVLARSGRALATTAAPAPAPVVTASATTSVPATAPTTTVTATPKAPRVAARRRPTPVGVADETAEKVAALLAERPSASAEDVAAAIGRAPRTARRYMSAARVRMAATGPAVAAG